MAVQKPPYFVLMPEWQGSPSSRAMLITDGAEYLREDLPASATLTVPVPVHTGDALGTPVARLSAVLGARDAAREILASRLGPAVTLGGDCASTLAGLERVVAADPGVAVIWCDAQPDLEDPSTSPSGAAARMALRHALGAGATELASPHPVHGSRVLLVGSRDGSPEESAALTEFGITEANALVQVAAGGDHDGAGLAAAIVDWLASIDATSLYIHIDLDVLDPAEFASVHAAVPFGLSVGALTAAIRAAVHEVPLAGAAICEFAPASAEAAPDDSGTVLRILAALTSGSRP